MLNVAFFIGRLKPWQAFLWTTGPFCAAAYFLNHYVPVGPSPEAMIAMFKLMMLVLLPVATTIYLWIWAIGIVSNKAAPPQATRKERFFNFAFPYTLAYFVFAYLFFPAAMQTQETVFPAGLVFSFHVFAVVCIVYAMSSAAMRLKSFEEGRLVGFGSAIGTFLMILYFPIGVWFVQRRLNTASNAATAA